MAASIAVPKPVHEISLELKRKLCFPQSRKNICITGCTISSTGKRVFVDCLFNKRLLIFNEEGDLSSELSLKPSMGFDVTAMDNDDIAVTTGWGKEIKIVNIVTKTILNTIHTDDGCFGITRNKDRLLFCEFRTGIRVLNLQDENIMTLIGEKEIPPMTYLVSLNSDVYFTNHRTHKVTCATIDGEFKWEFSDEMLLKNPAGITVDCSSCVYVISNGNYSVVSISHNGKEGKLVLNRHDGIDPHHSLCYDTTRNTLIVNNLYVTAFEYEVS